MHTRVHSAGRFKHPISSKLKSYLPFTTINQTLSSDTHGGGGGGGNLRSNQHALMTNLVHKKYADDEPFICVCYFRRRRCDPKTATDSSRPLELSTGHVQKTVFQLGVFPDGAAPCPYWLAPCPIYKRPARIIYLKKQKISYWKKKISFTKCCCVSDSRCKNACIICRFVPVFSSIAHKIVPRPRFVRVLDCDRILVVHA